MSATHMVVYRFFNVYILLYIQRFIIDKMFTQIFQQPLVKYLEHILGIFSVEEYFFRLHPTVFLICICRKICDK